MSLVLVTGPAIEPVSVAEAKAHLRVDADTDDALITALVAAARQHAEAVTRRALITQTWELVLDGWPSGGEIALPLPPLQSVTSIAYTDADAGEHVLDAGDYLVDTAAEPGRIVRTAAGWPSVSLQEAAAIRVRFVAGYGDAAADVDEAIRQAILLLVGHWYENREAVVGTGAVPKPLPLAFDALLWPYRIWGWV